MKLGFIGLGRMGADMACNLVKLSGNFLIAAIESLGEAIASLAARDAGQPR